MRKALPLIIAASLAVAATACGGGDDPTAVRAGQSGPPPVAEEVTTTTTVVEAPTTTLPLAVTEVPDVSDLGLSWDEEPVVDEATGTVTMGPFNQYIIDTPAPNAMMPEGTFDDLDQDELESALEVALPEAPAKAIALYLGLDPDDPDVQMLVGGTGGTEASQVVVIQTVEDDSIRAIRWEFRVQNQSLAGLTAADQETAQAAEGQSGDANTAAESNTQSEATPAGVDEQVDTQGEAAAIEHIVPLVYGGTRTVQCQPNRGHQDFTIGECV